MSPDRRVLLPVELSQRHPQDVLCSSTGRAEHITLTLVQIKAFKLHLARWEQSFSDSLDDSQAMIVYDYTAGRCCLYRATG